jgi:hypothetical protein
MDLGMYRPLALAPAVTTLTDAQWPALTANMQLCRAAIVFFTTTGATRGLSGHTGGPYDTVPEIVVLVAGAGVTAVACLHLTRDCGADRPTGRSAPRPDRRDDACPAV